MLNLCRTSVKDFVEFILSYIPKSTAILNTAEVRNVFVKEDIEEDGSEDTGPFLREDDSEEVRDTKQWIQSQFSHDKDPEPLYVLDLILKPGHLIPTYSTPSAAVVQSVRDVFEEGVKCLQEIPQLEPRLLHTLFKTHAKKTIKAPIIPQEAPKIPEK